MTGWLEQKQKKGQEDEFCVSGIKLNTQSLCAFGLERGRAAVGSRLWRAPCCCLRSCWMRGVSGCVRRGDHWCEVSFRISSMSVAEKD